MQFNAEDFKGLKSLCTLCGWTFGNKLWRTTFGANGESAVYVIWEFLFDTPLCGSCAIVQSNRKADYGPNLRCVLKSDSYTKDKVVWTRE